MKILYHGFTLNKKIKLGLHNVQEIMPYKKCNSIQNR